VSHLILLIALGVQLAETPALGPGTGMRSASSPTPSAASCTLHCYRILGSLQDAEDTVQETLPAAWRGLDQFEGPASVRAWLYRIATNRCLNVLRGRRRRPREVPAMVEPPQPTRLSGPIWLEPYPDVLLDELVDSASGPHARYELRETVGLAS
jgi:RNA polymerase sigma-70 factor (ECF subfamily)